MGSSTGSSRLYKEALEKFKKEAETKYNDKSEKLELLYEFLAQRGSPEEAKAAASNLKSDASKKWGSKKVGDAEIPGAWIDQIMSNIGNFVSVGNYAMEGAPESVGLAWFAVKLTLSAIQRNYDLYSLFGTGLTDISEIMVIISHYDRLYDEKAKAKADWKPGPVIEKLFQDIISTYVAVLRFSFSVKRHLSAGALAKIRHGFKDFFGISKEKFQTDLDLISTLKQEILDGSQAIFQDKSLQHLDNLKDIVTSIKGTVNEIKSFESTLQEMHEAQNAQWELVLRRMEVLDDIKATTKPKSPWELALHEFEMNRIALDPLKDTSDALGDAIDSRHPGTCGWIFEHGQYMEWKQSTKRNLLCLGGQEGSGKSVLLATIVEQMGMAGLGDTTLLYFSCGATGGGTKRVTLSVDRLCHTLLYQLYSLARQDENIKLLENCNKVFKNPKAKQVDAKLVARSSRDETLPNLADAFLSIAGYLKTRVVVAIDKIHNLSSKDQMDLAIRLRSILDADGASATDVSFKFLIGCRSGAKFYIQIADDEYEAGCVDVGSFNHEDLAKTVSDSLEDIPGLSSTERKEALSAIIHKAGSRFAYIQNVAIPFMREPFQRPLFRRLQSLPESMHNIYNEALRKMGPNYIDLLRTAVKMALLAPGPPKAQEVLDAYRFRYSTRGSEAETEARTLNEEEGEHRFQSASNFEIEQLRNASGPFLKIEKFEGGSDFFVNLQDAGRLRDFCLHAHPEEFEPRDDDRICARCKSDLDQSRSLSISEKESHLELALLCVRAMNNPTFQRRTMASIENMEDDSYDEETDKPDPTEDDGYESDDSRDEEDRGEINFSQSTRMRMAREGDILQETRTEARHSRYENVFWPYHIRRAQEVWSPEERKSESRWAELWDELDHWTSSRSGFFDTWQALPDVIPGYSKLKPIHIAGYYGLTSWADHLLNNGADPNEPTESVPYGDGTPLQLAALHADSRPMLKLLLEHGANPNPKVEHGFSAFKSWLLRESSVETIQLFLKHGADTTLVDSNSGWSALHCFAWTGKDVEALDLLLKETASGKKPDINIGKFSSPLHILLWRREVPKDLLKAFVDRGADVNRDDLESTRPLQIASTYGDLAALQILCEGRTIDEVDDTNKDGDTALYKAADGDHPKCIEFLVKRGANPDMRNNRGRAALHASALNGAKESVKVLISLGADLTLVDKHNRTPLFFACLGEFPDTANIILDALLNKKTPVAEINKKTTTHRTPLRQAASRGFEEVIDKLLKAAQAQNNLTGLEINAVDFRKGMTALHRAAWFGQVNCVRLLLASGVVDVSIRDSNGKTALKLAYEQWSMASQQTTFEDIISLLIKSDVEAAKDDAELVATCAVNGSMRLLKELAAIGSDLNRQDRYGWTPLELARKFQQHAVSKFLQHQAAWASMLPSRWIADSRTKVSENGKVVNHTGGYRVCISTDKPLPAGLDTYYFEVTSKEVQSGKKQPEWPEVATGFCTIGGGSIEFPGWPPRLNAPSARSWGFHGDNGGLYISTNDEGELVDEDLPYHAGHTVGCGVDLTSQTMWFTRNGQKLKAKFENVQGRLFPLLGLVDDVLLETNFTGPFLWQEGAGIEQIETVEKIGDGAGE